MRALSVAAADAARHGCAAENGREPQLVAAGNEDAVGVIQLVDDLLAKALFALGDRHGHRLGAHRFEQLQVHGPGVIQLRRRGNDQDTRILHATEFDEAGEYLAVLAASLGAADRDAALADTAALADQGYRVLAFAFGEGGPRLAPGGVPAEPAGMTFLGFTGMIDPLRPGVVDARAAGGVGCNAATPRAEACDERSAEPEESAEDQPRRVGRRDEPSPLRQGRGEPDAERHSGETERGRQSAALTCHGPAERPADGDRRRRARAGLGVGQGRRQVDSSTGCSLSPSS